MVKRFHFVRNLQRSSGIHHKEGLNERKRRETNNKGAKVVFRGGYNKEGDKSKQRKTKIERDRPRKRKETIEVKKKCGARGCSNSWW